jgi:hypothetical protein
MSDDERALEISAEIRRTDYPSVAFVREVAALPMATWRSSLGAEQIWLYSGYATCAWGAQPSPLKRGWARAVATIKLPAQGEETPHWAAEPNAGTTPPDVGFVRGVPIVQLSGMTVITGAQTPTPGWSIDWAEVARTDADLSITAYLSARTVGSYIFRLSYQLHAVGLLL